ncbi:MAG TPA: hypothetical protein VF179_25210 [Thermoanaerobaculia bacterium]|nr:hypothetical protein [Thermoanaerobaculia bacterium]
MRAYLVFLILLGLKIAARIFYRVDLQWIGDPPPDRWRHHRVVALLNHTSLYEPLFLGGVPNSFLWRLARHGVVPIAAKTADRAVVGKFFGLIAQNVISITRERDETWAEVLRKIDPDAMVAILPEGRMKRANGLDSEGRPMTVRGGIADILESIGEGRMLIAYSGGLHHVQVPGEKNPRMFQTVRVRTELVDIGPYREERMAVYGAKGFKKAVAEDLARRRDLHCPVEPHTDSPERVSGTLHASK